MPSTPQQASQIVTLAPPTAPYPNPRWLATIGHVNGLKHGWSLPGGDDMFSATLAVMPQYRTDALNPGRITRIYRGASCIWNGVLDEPVGGSTGWSITGHGAGTLSSSYMADFASWDLNTPLNNAIGRGLNWVNPGIGSGWLTPTIPDNDSEYITDFLNGISIQAGLTWYVSGPENRVNVVTLPTVADRLLICTVPVARTIAADINWLWYKYQSGVDVNGTATYAYGHVSNASACALHGNLESTIDLSGAGTMSSGQASTNANNVLSLYQRANFAGAFSVRYGQLLTMGGSPIDLGTERVGPHVYRLMITDSSFGGEFTAGPIQFVGGNYVYDDDAQLAQITPLQSYKSDLATLLTALVPTLRQ